jgi:peptidase M41-like protein
LILTALLIGPAIVAGLEKRNRLLNPLERRVVAYHELGHTVALVSPGTDTVHKVSIIPRGVGALGCTIQRPTEDRYLMTRAELENKMAVLLGGRAAVPPSRLFSMRCQPERPTISPALPTSPAPWSCATA